jgi:hypothetical protein
LYFLNPKTIFPYTRLTLFFYKKAPSPPPQPPPTPSPPPAPPPNPPPAPLVVPVFVLVGESSLLPDLATLGTVVLNRERDGVSDTATPALSALTNAMAPNVTAGVVPFIADAFETATPTVGVVLKVVLAPTTFQDDPLPFDENGLASALTFENGEALKSALRKQGFAVGDGAFLRASVVETTAAPPAPPEPPEPPPKPPTPPAPSKRDASLIDPSVLYPLAGTFGVVGGVYGIVQLVAAKKKKKVAPARM